MTRRALLAATLISLSATAGAVGLAPLKLSGLTDGNAKAFYLTLSNPYRTREAFETRALRVDSEDRVGRVQILPADPVLPPGGKRRLLVIVRDLAPGETHRFRLCAARKPKPEESVYARVCSTLTARRLAVRV